MGEREPVTTTEELSHLDKDETVEGYLDGLNGEPEPGDNRSKSYWHGWRNGHADRTGNVSADQRVLARQLLEKWKRNA